MLLFTLNSIYIAVKTSRTAELIIEKMFVTGTSIFPCSYLLLAGIIHDPASHRLFCL